MEKFIGKLLDHKWLVLFVFGISFIVCLFLMLTVDVNYDMQSYLPSNAPSTIALDKFEEEFSDGVYNTRVLISDISIGEALEKKKEFNNIEGVKKVVWLDDVLDIKKPIEAYNKKMVEPFYKDSSALFLLTISSENRSNAVLKVQEIAGKNAKFSGSMIESTDTMINTSGEVTKIMLFVVPFIFFILIITTSSWIEPIILLLTIGIAIVLNNGTNAFRGEISFVTRSASSLLQLAVSMDYTIFLFHRFSEQLKLGREPRDAIIKATKLSFKSVLSSGLTTAIGFAVLVIMRFKIGPDMGIVMTKGIFFSLLSVFLLLPVLLLFSYKLIEKTKHRVFMPKFTILNKIIGRSKNITAIILLIVFVSISFISYFAQLKNDFSYGSSRIIMQNSKLGKDRDYIEEVFGKDNQMVVLVPNDDISKEYEFIEKVKKIPEYTYNFSYSNTVGYQVPKEILNKSQSSNFYSNKYSRIVLGFDAQKEGENVYKIIDDVRKKAKDVYGKNYYLLGESVTTYDMKVITGFDSRKVNLIAIFAVGLVILMAFKSFTIPIILLLVIQTSIWLNMSVPYFSDNPIFFITFLIASSIQLGATVDYAILFSNRYIENRAILGVREAVQKTYDDTTISILTSGIILTVAGFSLKYISANKLVGEHGELIGRGAFLSLLSVLIFLPLFLIVFDKVIEKTTLGVDFLKKEEE